jgi:hypothetical protein
MDNDTEIKFARETIAQRKLILENDLAVIEGLEYQLGDKQIELDAIQDSIASLTRELDHERRMMQLTEQMVKEAERDLERLLMTEEDIEAEREHERQAQMLKKRYGTIPASVADWWVRV